ncbi:hypothetical protein [Microbacterium sp. Root180]|uniref:hypothetical protein n=1 Tax=Microbacterium sp. Root180 TaxID=1736483 RepID=UPI0006FF93E4|nr:hypothetical protein [Microbacterium sp. Root180]KRB36132.1 hypothetical protein ASD93_08450 [Microbacterium sp. Root180]
MLRFTMHLDFTGSEGAKSITDLAAQLELIAIKLRDSVSSDLASNQPRQIPASTERSSSMPIADWLGYRVGQWKVASNPRRTSPK